MIIEPLKWLGPGGIMLRAWRSFEVLASAHIRSFLFFFCTSVMIPVSEVVALD